MNGDGEDPKKSHGRRVLAIEGCGQTLGGQAWSFGERAIGAQLSLRSQRSTFDVFETGVFVARPGAPV